MKSPIKRAQQIICSTLSNCIKQKLDVSISPEELLNCCEKSKSNKGEIGIHFFRFKKKIKIASDKFAKLLSEEFDKVLNSNENDVVKNLIQRTETNGPFLNFYLRFSFFVFLFLSFEILYFNPFKSSLLMSFKSSLLMSF